MNKDRIVQLTQNLYYLTLLFPKKEPLRYKMRDIAGDIAELFLQEQDMMQESAKDAVAAKCAVLDGLFEVAKSQNWTSLADVIRIQREYKDVHEMVRGKRVSSPPLARSVSREKLPYTPPVSSFEHADDREEKSFPVIPRQEAPVSSSEQLNGRQGKIIDFLKSQRKAQVWQIQELLGDVTKRTLRRDFHNLLERGIIERVGERNETFYQLKSSEREMI